MDSVQTKTFLSLLPRIPLVLRVALLHVLRLSKQSRYVDLRTALTIAVIRSFIKTSQPRSISSTQRLFLGDPGVKGRIWVSRYTAPVPPDDAHGGVRDVLGRAIQALGGHDGSRAGFHVPELAPVEAEWTGYRPGVARNSALEVTSDKDTFDRMMQDCASGGPTVLYLHGGAYWLMDPATHRPTCKRLAKMTGGRCYSVRYRLAPKHAFPSALMDALVSYLTLLYPPPEAFHQPVEARSIVFAGDR